MDLSIQRSPVIKFRLHIIIGTLLLIVFILIIARITDSGTPKTRTNIWGIVVGVDYREQSGVGWCCGYIGLLSVWVCWAIGVCIHS
ncbi:hypothetical protein EN45_075390 [Penicillium chrysogenum]|uniref:Uncharacterized protein n=1 Tax=Penicillium chrysogenum TaxID=5076 RepID=A0A167U5P3_PENCH|nr:hypothetical protein EN45_075390 [Penicillium chrysogenum]